MVTFCERVIPGTFHLYATTGLPGMILSSQDMIWLNPTCKLPKSTPTKQNSAVYAN